MDDTGIPISDIFMRELCHHFGPTVPQAVFDFVGSNRIGLTAQQKREVLVIMAALYYEGIAVGRQTVGADEAESVLYQQLDRLAQRIAKLEKNA